MASQSRKDPELSNSTYYYYRRKKRELELQLSRLRRMLRQRMEWLAKSHRGCAVARGCGCVIDRSLTLLDKTEHDLFQLELESYAATFVADQQQQGEAS